jgi:hypothetical protein
LQFEIIKIKMIDTNKDDKRFMAKVSIRKNGCWIWKASRRGKYGCFSYKSKAIDAHRWSYLRWNGHIPEGMFVCHKCDNPLCVNPEHLFLGTHEENMKDASRKGRLNQRKLTERQVFNIRMSNLSNQQLARKYGVWDSTIRRIRKYETWNKKG